MWHKIISIIKAWCLSTLSFLYFATIKCTVCMTPCAVYRSTMVVSRKSPRATELEAKLVACFMKFHFYLKE